MGGGGGKAPRCVDICGSSGWKSWTSAAEDDDVEDSYVQDSDQEDLEENHVVPGLSSGRACMPTVDQICGVDGGRTTDVKVPMGTGKVAMRRQAVLWTVHE